MASLSSIMKKVFKTATKIDPLGAKIMKNTEDLPGTPGSLRAAFLSDQPSDPYGPQQGKFDIFAGGKKLSESKSARNIGRAVGTVAALYFGGGAMGGESAAAGGTTGGAATTGTTAAGAGTGAAASKGILGTGVSAGTAASTVATAASIAEQRKIAKAAEEAAMRQSQAFDESLNRLRRDTPQTPTLDEARRRAEQADAQRRKRGRRASILTGETGVGFTPVSQRTLLGA